MRQDMEEPESYIVNESVELLKQGVAEDLWGEDL